MAAWGCGRCTLWISATFLATLIPTAGSVKLAPPKKLNFTALANGDAWRRKKAELKEAMEQHKLEKERVDIQRKIQAEQAAKDATKAKQAYKEQTEEHRRQEAEEKQRLAEERRKSIEATLQAHNDAMNARMKAEAEANSHRLEKTLHEADGVVKRGLASLLPKGPLFTFKKKEKKTSSMPAGWDNPPPQVAMCISGNLRTFGEREVYRTVRPFLDHLGAKGLNSSSPDLFLYGTLASDSPKQQHHFGFAALNVTRSSMRVALESIKPVAYELVMDASEVTEENVDNYIVNRQECFTSDKKVKQDFWNDINYLTRSLNQLVHMQRCIDLMTRHEQQFGKKYDIVITARPDLKYYEREVTINLRAYEGAVLHQWDWLMVLPRSLADNLVNRDYARPLRCSPGEYCCGYIHRSEAMWEYLTGSPMDQGGYTCDCTNVTQPSKLVDVAILERTERID